MHPNFKYERDLDKLAFYYWIWILVSTQDLRDLLYNIYVHGERERVSKTWLAICLSISNTCACIFLDQTIGLRLPTIAM